MCPTFVEARIFIQQLNLSTFRVYFLMWNLCAQANIHHTPKRKLLEPWLNWLGLLACIRNTFCWEVVQPQTHIFKKKKKKNPQIWKEWEKTNEILHAVSMQANRRETQATRGFWLFQVLLILRHCKEPSHKHSPLHYRGQALAGWLAGCKVVTYQPLVMRPSRLIRTHKVYVTSVKFRYTNHVVGFKKRSVTFG